MPLFFHDESIRCPKCGCTLLCRDVLYTLEEDPKAPGEYIARPSGTVFTCSNCHASVKSVSPLETVHVMPK